MRKLVGNTLLTGLTVVFCLLLTEIGIRVIDGLPVLPVMLPGRGGAIGTDTTASHLGNIPLANGVDRAWFAAEPPPLPNRTTPPQEWIDLDKQLLRTPNFNFTGQIPFKSWDLFKAWNSAFVGDVCKHTYLRGAPGRLYVYDPADGQPRPFFRFLPNATAPDGLVTNAFSWRGPPVQFQKAPKTVRIVFVGASTVAEIHHYPFSVPEYVGYWLNRWAEARKLDVKFEVLNAGRESIISVDIAGIVRQEVAPTRPDLVVYYEGNNQLQLSTVVKNVPTGIPLPAGDVAQALRRAADYSAVARRAEGFTSGAEWPKPAYELTWPQGVDEQNPDITRTDLPVNLTTILGHLDSIRADLAKVDSEFALSTFHWLAKDGLVIDALTQKPLLENLNVGYFPFRYRDLERMTTFENRVFTKYAATHGIPLVDVARYMPYDPELFTDATHNTPPGVKLRAWVVLQQLVPVVEKRLASGAWPKPVPVMGDTHPAFTVPPRVIKVDCKAF